MGTRSTTQIRIGGVPRLTIYKQYDGYLEGVGNEILPILKKSHVNGYTDKFTQYNGPDNFCAMLVAQFMIQNITSNSIGCGGAYIKDHSQHGQEEWTYTIDFENPDYEDWNAKQLPPKISVKAYRFIRENMTVEEFEKLVAEGLPDDEE